MVQFNNGNGTFGAPTSYPTPVFGATVRVADVNGDGIPDVAVSSAGAVSLLPGVGNGAFAAPITYPAAGSTGDVTGLALGDLNGDGRIDVTGGVSVLLNRGCM